jgi:hypothetical protein
MQANTIKRLATHVKRYSPFQKWRSKAPTELKTANSGSVGRHQIGVTSFNAIVKCLTHEVAGVYRKTLASNLKS